MTSFTTQPTDHPADRIVIPWWALTAVFLLLWWLGPALLASSPLAWLTHEQAAWFLNRSSGVVAYLLLALSTIWGLLLSTQLIKRAVPPLISLAMHNYLSWGAVALSGFHAVVLLFDTYYTYQPVHLLVPFVGPYNPAWVGVGIIAFYLMLFVSLTWLFRQRLGTRIWKRLHYLSFVATLLALLHGLMAGSDTAVLVPLYLGSGVLISFLTIYRILEMITRASEP